MYYAMLYGHLPFWADTEDDFIDKIISQPLKFDTGVHITNECKELLKGMLHKNPEKRVQLIEVMALPYFFMDDSELED
jgi:serine/threonine protein kinase